MGFPKLSHLILLISCVVFVSGNFSCTFTSDISPSPAEPDKSTALEPIKTPRTKFSANAEETSNVNSSSYRYGYIFDKLLAGNFPEASKDLSQFAQTCYYPQRYGLEAQILRFCLLASLRKSYLTLGSVYKQGWIRIFHSDRPLPKEDRLNRLTNLSETHLFYYRQQKEITNALISAYHALIQIYPELPAEQLRIAGKPFEQHDFISNPYLNQIKQGEWLDANTRAEAEKIEFNNSFFTFFLTLLGVKDIKNANALLGQKSVILNKHGFLSWLSQSLKYQLIDTATLGDEPGLMRILENKSAECRKLLEQILAEEKGKKNPLDRFDPLTLMK